MTDSRPLTPTSNGLAGLLRVLERGDDFACCNRGHKPREQWTFTGREAHWGYVFLVWTRDDGKRFARWVR